MSLEGYRFGYQGSEKDNEFKGQGNSYTTEFRQLDPRLGRWLSVDPKPEVGISTYTCMDNNTIFYNDVLGLYTKRRAESLAKKGSENGYVTCVKQQSGSKNNYGVAYTKRNDSNTGTYMAQQFKGRFRGTENMSIIMDSEITFEKIVEDSPDVKSSLGYYLSFEFIRSSLIRNQYKSTVQFLDPMDNKGREYIKQLSRDLTPPIMRSIITSIRPSTSGKSGSVSSANKTNFRANNLANNIGNLGKGVFVLSFANSINNVTSSVNKSDQIIIEATTSIGGFTGAALGAEVGAVVGGFFGGVGAVPGALIGGFIGGVYGSNVGDGAGREINNLRD